MFATYTTPDYLRGLFPDYGPDRNHNDAPEIYSHDILGLYPDEPPDLLPEDVAGLFPVDLSGIHPADLHPDELPLNIRDFDLHALDVEDMRIDVQSDVDPVNASLQENFTYVPYNSTWVFGMQEDRFILPVLLCLFGVCALMSNMMIILGIVLPRHMRSGANLMFLNISMADLVFILFCIPSSMMNHAHGVGQGPLTDEWCRFIHYIMFVTVYVGIYTLVVICVFRLCSEIMETKFSSLLSRGNAVMSCAVIWMAFLLSNINLLVQREDAIFHEPFICMHSDIIADPNKMRTLWLTFLACAFFLPLIMITILSVVFLHRISRLERRHREHSESRRKREFTMVTMTTMFIRTLCWLPIQIFVIMDLFGFTDFTTFYRKAEMVGVCSAFLGASMNGFVFKFMSREFSLAFGYVSARLACKDIDDSYTDTSHHIEKSRDQEVDDIVTSFLTGRSDIMHNSFTKQDPYKQSFLER